MELINLDRKSNLLNKVVFIDGQPGSGKTLFTSLLSTLERVEIYNYCCEIENIVALKYLNKIPKDAAKTLLKIQTDLAIYEIMMSRRMNFRIKDVSSALNSTKKFKYLKRLFEKGDETIPGKIIKNKPILHYLSHNLIPFSQIVFESLDSKMFLIEIVRHPLYMIIQQTLNHINQYEGIGSARQFHLSILSNNHQLPFHVYEYENEYIKAKPIERAIIDMKILNNLRLNFFKTNTYKKNSNNILTIPFEKFVLKPDDFILLICKLLKTKITNTTTKILKKNKVPRKKFSESIPLEIYKRCGWEPPDKNLTEKGELLKRKKFVLDQKPNSRYLEILNKLCTSYEEENNLIF